MDYDPEDPRRRVEDRLPWLFSAMIPGLCFSLGLIFGFLIAELERMWK